MFSILDIQDTGDDEYLQEEGEEENEREENREEKEEGEEEEEEEEDVPIHLRPIRVSFTITKVCVLPLLRSR
jgi:hypothetical protein